MSDVATGATLGSGQCQPFVAQHVAHNACKWQILISNNMVTQPLAQLEAEAVHLRFQPLAVGRLTGQPQVDDSWLGQVGQMDALRQLTLPFIQFHGQGTLNDSHHHQVAELNVNIVTEMSHELRYDLTDQHGLGLIGDSRHAHQHLAVMFEPHQWSRAALVLDHTARRWHHGLRTSVIVQFEMTPGNNALNIAGCRLVIDQLSTEVSAQRGLGDVVLCRTQTACHEHNVAMDKRLVDSIEDGLPIVGYSSDVDCLPTIWGEVAGNITRICILHLANENLIANNYD